jgi:hypothetical protein
MRKIATLAAILILASTLTAQVTVSQEYLQDSARAFIELKALREVDQAQKAEIEARKAENAAKSDLIAALKREIEAKDILTRTLTEQNKDLARLKCDKTTFLFHLVTIKRCK